MRLAKEDCFVTREWVRSNLPLACDKRKPQQK
jgi:hypothetical protein